MILSGTGRKNISAGDLKINGNLVIRNGAVLSNANYNRTLYIGGNWINENTVTGRFIPGRGTVVFDGDGVQSSTPRFRELLQPHDKHGENLTCLMLLRCKH